MRKLRLFMILFCVLIFLPLAFVAWRTYAALDREARSQVVFFSERLLDEIEADLADRVRREEDRAVDEYRHTMVQSGGTIVSPLAAVPAETYILGYFQNNPDGSFQTPLVEDTHRVSAELVDRVRQLEIVNQRFNRRKRVAKIPSPPVQAQSPSAVPGEKEPSAFADRFLKTAERKKTKSVLGQEQTRVEEITAGQAMNLARQEPSPPPSVLTDNADEKRESDAIAPSADPSPSPEPVPPMTSSRRRQPVQPPTDEESGRYQVEVAPLQAVSIDEGRVFIFRRIDIKGRIYRQGFVLRLAPFLDHLLAIHYASQPIARYTRLTLNAAGLTVSRGRTATDTDPMAGQTLAGRTFPAPFRFLTAEMHAVSLPPSPARRVLTLTLIVLGIVIVGGLAILYLSTRAVLDLSERRSRFVSTVTHELKTPLTNIRMYIEMLEQGIAATPEREHAYMQILASESARLSGLITNVLELSRLEQRARRLDLEDGDLSDVLAEVQSAMAGNLAREGFDLTVQREPLPVFAYDRDVLVQVLVNLMENSIKFGRHLPEKRIAITAHVLDGWILLKVSDTGPGIPKRCLKKVFDDFYRVDAESTRNVGGTGIGLALVKKLILALGGRVRAENNHGPGCTITLSLPVNRQPQIR